MSPSSKESEGMPAAMRPKPLSPNGPATAVSGLLRLSTKAALLNQTLPCHDFLKALVDGGLRTDAVKFIAGWLPPREALWFATLGVWQVARLQPGTAQREIIDQVVAYVTEPSQGAWSAFGSLTQAAKDSSPTGLLIQAAILTGDNICPYPKKTIRPKPGLAGKAAANALVAAASKWPGKDRNACLDSFIALGLEIAEGKHLWAPNPDQKYPGLRTASRDSMFGKTRNIWE